MQCPLCKSTLIESIFRKTDKHTGVREYNICNNCKLIFLTPDSHLDSSEEKKRYNQHQNNPADKRYVDFLQRLVTPLKPKLKKNAFGLDFGCGPGPTISTMLKKEGYNVDNYDPYYFPNRSLLNKQYDFITCTEVVEHFYQPHNEFLLLNKLLQSNTGYLAIMTEFFSSDIDFSSWWYHKDPTHVCFYQKSTFNWIANWLNLQVEYPNKNIVIYTKNYK